MKEYLPYLTQSNSISKPKLPQPPLAIRFCFDGVEQENKILPERTRDKVGGDIATSLEYRIYCI